MLITDPVYILFAPQYTNHDTRFTIAIALRSKPNNVFEKNGVIRCRAGKRSFTKKGLWYNEVEDSGLKVFRTVARSIETHHQSIFNYFDNRSTNASAESFNAKIKAFRAAARGVRDIHFFLFRLAKLYA